jgi:hypothetical protein
VGLVAGIGKTGNAYGISEIKPQRKRRFGRIRYRCKILSIKYKNTV